jgi:lysozyme family protein
MLREEWTMPADTLFDRAVEVVLAHEGEGCSDDPGDRGGPTRFGISQRWNPDIALRELTREQAIKIYRACYWSGRGYGLPEEIAIKTFDLAVNLGERMAIRCRAGRAELGP